MKRIPCKHFWRQSVPLMPSSHCTIFALIFTRWQVLRNRRQIAKIGGTPVLVHASDNHAVWINKDVVWENHWRPWNIWHAKYSIWSCRRFKILLCEMSSDWNIHRRWPTANESARCRAAGSSGRTFFFIKQLAMDKQRGNISTFWH